MEIRLFSHQFNMKSIVLILFCFSSSLTFGQSRYEALFADSLKEIVWSCGIVYLPSTQSEAVFIKAKRSRLRAYYQIDKFRKRFRRKKVRKFNINKEEFAEYYDLYSALNDGQMNFPISEEDKDSLRAFIGKTNYKGERLYQMTSEVLEAYLEVDTIQLDLSVFEKDSFINRRNGLVIDGAPFRFSLTHISKSNDTIPLSYEGNLAGGNRFSNSPSYLSYGILYHETKLFKKLPFQEYFSRSNLLRAVLFYIEVKEGYYEFKPFELIWEDE